MYATNAPCSLREKVKVRGFLRIVHVTAVALCVCGQVVGTNARAATLSFLPDSAGSDSWHALAHSSSDAKGQERCRAVRQVGQELFPAIGKKRAMDVDRRHILTRATTIVSHHGVIFKTDPHERGAAAGRRYLQQATEVVQRQCRNATATVLSQEERALHDICADFIPRYLGHSGPTTAMESAAMGLNNASIVDLSFDTMAPWVLGRGGRLRKIAQHGEDRPVPRNSWRFPWRCKSAYIWQLDPGSKGPGSGSGHMKKVQIEKLTPLQVLRRLFVVEGQLQSELITELVSEMRRLHHLLGQQQKWSFKDSSMIVAFENAPNPPFKTGRPRLKLVDFAQNQPGEARTWGLELLMADMLAFLESGGNEATLVLPSIQDHGRREMEWYAKRNRVVPGRRPEQPQRPI